MVPVELVIWWTVNYFKCLFFSLAHFFFFFLSKVGMEKQEASSAVAV